MLFNSFEFLLFLPIAFLLYWFVFQKNLKVQNAFLLLASYLFYGWWDWRFLGLIILSSAVDYWCGIRLAASSNQPTGAGQQDNAKQTTRQQLKQTTGQREAENPTTRQLDNAKQTTRQPDNRTPRSRQPDNSFSGQQDNAKQTTRQPDNSSVFGLPSSVLKPFQGRNFYLTLSLVFNLGLLGFFKYFNFFIDSATEFITLLGFQAHPSTLNLILPVGISFYTFQTMSYTIDVYRGRLEPTKDPIAFFTFVAFFPQLVAGPIERASNLLPQFFKKRQFQYQQGSDGMKLILWGLFKKMVIADNCALVVNPIFDNYQSASVLELIMGAVLFAFQIYGDFSGYSDIAIGTAKLFGFELMINFRTPYFSRDIAEFWRRWHISLSTWFRDYVYIPLGGSRVSTAKAIRNIFIVFLVSGFWHGANWTFIAWGGIHAALFIPIFLIGKNRAHLQEGEHLLPSLREVFQMILTFLIVTIAWVFFRAETITVAAGYLSSMVTNPFSEGFRLSLFYLPLAAVGMMLVLEWIFKGKQILSFQFPALRYAGYAGVVFTILFFGAFFNPRDFIYFQF